VCEAEGLRLRLHNLPLTGAWASVLVARPVSRARLWAALCVGARAIRPQRLRVFQGMNRIVTYAAALGLAAGAVVGLSACGSSPSSSSNSGSGASRPAAASDTVSLKSVSGVGSVLVDSKGFALYSPTQEQTGTIPEARGRLAPSLRARLGVAFDADARAWAARWIPLAARHM
jgi:hypothetical protein